MPRIHAVETTSVSSERVLEVARDFSERFISPFFPFGLARSTVAGHARHSPAKVEEYES